MGSLWGHRWDLGLGPRSRRQGPRCSETGTSVLGDRDLGARKQGTRCSETGTSVSVPGTSVLGDRDLGARKQGPRCSETGTSVLGNRDLGDRDLGLGDMDLGARHLGLGGVNDLFRILGDPEGRLSPSAEINFNVCFKIFFVLIQSF